MKRIILTGASEGLGAAIGQLCVSRNIEVVALSRKAPAYPCVHIPTNLRQPTAIEATAAEIKAKYSAFDAIINCAGILAVEKPNAITYAKLTEVIEVNTLAPIYLVSQLFDALKTNQADILNVSSTVGTKGYADQAAYGASKWALRGFSQNLQTELAKTACRVIQFNPGGFRSQIFAKATGESKDLSQFMDPADLAKLILTILELPKNIEVSEILINRKATA